MRFEFVHAEKANHSVRTLCRVLQVSPSGYYAWRQERSGTRRNEDAVLAVHIRAIYKRSRRTYGSPRVTEQLKREGFAVGRNRVARLMRQEGLEAVPPKRFRVTTDSKHSEPVAPNLLARQFDPAGPNEAWATDITYVRTWQGWLYLAVVIDLFSRRVVGWAADSHMRTELVLDALAMALARRRPGVGLVHHSDRGSQYASKRYQDELERHGIIASMSRKGDCWDNAVAESFFRHHQGRAAGPPPVGDPLRGQRSHFGVHRAVLQRHEAALAPRLCQSGRVRIRYQGEEGSGSITKPSIKSGQRHLHHGLLLRRGR